MLNKLLVSGDPALEPLVITEDKAISIGRDHIKTPQALANLFCSQLHRLKTTYIDASSGKFYSLSCSLLLNNSVVEFQVWCLLKLVQFSL